MEKIYEEKSSYQNRSKMRFSIILSFVVAAFAIMSLVVFGFNQISYAAPSEGSTTAPPVPEFATWPGTDHQIFLMVTGATDLDSESPDNCNIYVPVIYDTTKTENNYLFCVQQGTALDKNYFDDYDSADGLSDSVKLGLASIINKSSLNGGDGVAIPKNKLNEGNNKYLEYYATQVAIWLYLDKNTPASSPYHGKLDTDISSCNPREAINNTQELHMVDLDGTEDSDPEPDPESEEEDEDGIKLFDANDAFDYFNDAYKIDSTVSKASSDSIATIQASLASKDITLEDDGKTYQTAKITAKHSGGLTRYYVDITGLDGAYAVDKDGKKLTDAGLGPDDYFYVRIPVDKVKDGNTVGKIKLSGDFDVEKGGGFYAVTGSQAVMRIEPIQLRVDNELPINFVASPDTGMTTAQTIYFIGLIVLLCGVGIIYANAKPVEEK